jgi:hypothetical protein
MAVTSVEGSAGVAKVGSLSPAVADTAGVLTSRFEVASGFVIALNIDTSELGTDVAAGAAIEFAIDTVATGIAIGRGGR